jgi:hypothetical protein
MPKHKYSRKKKYTQHNKSNKKTRVISGGAAAANQYNSYVEPRKLPYIPRINTNYEPQTEIEKIVVRYPKKKWDWNSLVQNPNITMEFIKTKLEELRKRNNFWHYLSGNPNLTLEFIYYNPNSNHSRDPWDWNSISKNPNFTMQIIERYVDPSWKWSRVDETDKRMKALVKSIRSSENKDKNIPDTKWDFWDWKAISSNPNLTINFVKKYFKIKLRIKQLKLKVNPEKIKKFANFDWYVVSSHHNITMDDIEQNPDLPWVFKYVSKNPNLTMKFVEEHPENPQEEQGWDWNNISENPGITMEDIKNHPDKPWKWKYISKNPNLTMEFVKAHSDRLWDWSAISCNPNIKMDDIENNKDKFWICEFVSKNPNLTMNFIEKYPHLPWDWSAISCNPNIKMEDVKQDLSKPWDWFSMSRNPNLTMEMVVMHQETIQDDDDNVEFQDLPNDPNDNEYYDNDNDNVSGYLLNDNINLHNDNDNEPDHNKWSWSLISSNKLHYSIGSVDYHKKYKKTKEFDQEFFAEQLHPNKILEFIKREESSYNTNEKKQLFNKLENKNLTPEERREIWKRLGIKPRKGNNQRFTRNTTNANRKRLEQKIIEEQMHKENKDKKKITLKTMLENRLRKTSNKRNASGVGSKRSVSNKRTASKKG